MIKSGKYLQNPSELAVEISKVFETKPTRKQVADYMSDKFGTDKNKPSFGDFIDTLDSVMNDINFYYSDDGKIESSRKIASAKYDSDTSNLRAMKIPEDLPTWIFKKYVDETNQHNKEWVWYYFLEAIKHNPWKSGFTGDSLYATDGNIDIVVGPQQARCRLYKVTPKSQSMTELPYAAGGKKDDFYDWYIDKRYIDAFIKDVLHNYIWSRIKSSRKSIKSALKKLPVFELCTAWIPNVLDQRELVKHFKELGIEEMTLDEFLDEVEKMPNPDGIFTLKGPNFKEEIKSAFLGGDGSRGSGYRYSDDGKIESSSCKSIESSRGVENKTQSSRKMVAPKYDARLEEHKIYHNDVWKLELYKLKGNTAILRPIRTDDWFVVKNPRIDEDGDLIWDSDTLPAHDYDSTLEEFQYYSEIDDRLPIDKSKKFSGQFTDEDIENLSNSHKPLKSALSRDEILEQIEFYEQQKEKVSVDVNSLYHFLTDSETAEVEGDFAIVRCDEDDGETYYDILSDGDLACMDGETCEIVGRGEGFIELHSIEADDGVNFKLSSEEFEVACGKSKKQIKSSLTSDSFEMMVKESRKMAEDMNSNLDDWWVTKEVGQDVVYFVAEHKDYSVRVRFEFVDSGFCYVSKTYTNGSYYEPVVLESWKYEGLSSQEIEGKMTAVLNDFFPKYNEIGSSKKPVESSVDYEPLTKLLDDLGAYPESRMPPAGIYKRLLDWKVGSEGMDEKEAREKFGTFTVGEWIDDLKESVM